jgi:homoserine kinase type II
MAVLTPLPLPSAQALGARWGLDVTHARGIPAGSVNSSYEIGLAGGGRVFLRIYEEQTLTSASFEAGMLDHLAERGVATPRPLPLAGGDGEARGFVAEHEGKPVAVFPWVDGEVLCQGRVTPERARRVGEALGRVHRAGASLEGAPPSRFGLADLAARLTSLADPLRSLPEDVAAVLPDLAARVARHEAEPPLPEGALIHGDLFRDNVLWQGEDIVALIDFESASRGSLAFDLMVTVLAWCFGDDLDLDLSRAMVAGYRAALEIPAEERARLHDAARLAATRFAITRITDFELRRGSGVYKDYRRFLARLAAVERFGAADFPDALGA